MSAHLRNWHLSVEDGHDWSIAPPHDGRIGRRDTSYVLTLSLELDAEGLSRFQRYIHGEVDNPPSEAPEPRGLPGGREIQEPRRFKQVVAGTGHRQLPAHEVIDAEFVEDGQ